MKKWKQFYLLDLARYGDSKPDKKVSSLLKWFRKCQFSSNRFIELFNRLIFAKIKDKLHIELFGKNSTGGGYILGILME